MIPVTFSQIAEAVDASDWGTSRPTGGLVSQDSELTGQIVHDSRKITPGDLYIALVGETHDGHDFVSNAIESGAVALVVAKAFATDEALQDMPDTVTVFVVDDTLQALGRIANLVLNLAPQVEVVAVTGSSGKTSVKDLMAQVFAPHGSTIAPPGSFNNEIGLPMTVLQVDRETRYLILEMGARGLGHIRTLTEIARPNIGVVLNVGSAHAGEFGSIEGTQQAKQELIEALGPDGIAILNDDDPRVKAMAEVAPGRVISFGSSSVADVGVANVDLDELARPSFQLEIAAQVSEQMPDGASLDIKLKLAGAHNALNSAAAAAAAIAAGIDPEQIAQSLNDAENLSPGRMNILEAADGLTVIDDSYNANVESMLAGLKGLAQAGRGRTTWAVLGEMRELGDDSVMAHDEVGRAVVRLGIDNLIVVGQSARPMFLAAAAEGFYNGESRFADTIDDAEQILGQHLQSNDVVFVKASRAAGLDQLVTALLEAHN
ncbi:MAG: UDP-N-acetylmuramoyl-tripeptide--D-alanyl-D-alanine ligase [Candidatus Nanopelagicales bacterium]